MHKFRCSVIAYFLFSHLCAVASTHEDQITGQQQLGCMMCHQGDRDLIDSKTRDLKKHVAYLTQNTLRGRLTGSSGERLAAQYVADELHKFGFSGAGDNDTFFQTFYFSAPDDIKKKAAPLEM